MSKAFGVIVAFASVVGLTAACGFGYYDDCCSPYQAVNSLLCGCGCDIGYCGYGCESSKSPRRCRGGCCCSCCSAPGYEYGSRDADASGDGFEAEDGLRGGGDSDDQAVGRSRTDDRPRGGRASDDQVRGRSGSARYAGDGEKEAVVGLGIGATRPGGKRGSDDQVAVGIEIEPVLDVGVGVGEGLGTVGGLVDLKAPILKSVTDSVTDTVGLGIGTRDDKELLRVSIDGRGGRSRDTSDLVDLDVEVPALKFGIGDDKELLEVSIDERGGRSRGASDLVDLDVEVPALKFGIRAGDDKELLEVSIDESKGRSRSRGASELVELHLGAGNMAGPGYSKPSGFNLMSKTGKSLIYDPFNIIPLTKCLCLI